MWLSPASLGGTPLGRRSICNQMAVCDTPSLISQSCNSGFPEQGQRSMMAIKLQLVSNLAGNTASIEDLKNQACASGFINQSKANATAIELQLWCNFLGSPSGCVNVIPDGALYEGTNFYDVPGLVYGNSYSITWGVDEFGIQINGVMMLSAGAGNTSTFTASASNVLVGIEIGISITAIIC